MKKEQTETAPRKLTRTVKISDDLHYELSVISASKRIAMQNLVEKAIRAGLSRLRYTTAKPVAETALV